MKNRELENNREKDLKELTMIIEDVETKKLFQTFLTLVEINKINLSFLTKHLKLSKTAARIISNAGIIDPSIGMLLLNMELQRKTKVDVQNWWKDKVETKFKKMQVLLAQSLEQIENCGGQIEAELLKLIDK